MLSVVSLDVKKKHTVFRIWLKCSQFTMEETLRETGTLQVNYDEPGTRVKQLHSQFTIEEHFTELWITSHSWGQLDTAEWYLSSLNQHIRYLMMRWTLLGFRVPNVNGNTDYDTSRCMLVSPSWENDSTENPEKYFLSFQSNTCDKILGRIKGSCPLSTLFETVFTVWLLILVLACPVQKSSAILHIILPRIELI